MSSLYPKYQDVFTVKRNEQGDGNGDHVMAEHVNDLQNAILAIEGTLGTNPQGGEINVNQRLEAIETNSRSFRIPGICIYNGDPVLINGSVSAVEAADRFSYFKCVILTQGIEEGVNELHNKTIELISKASRVNFCGTIDAIESLNSIYAKSLAWKNMGAKGVYLKNFGYENGLDRTKQNAALNYIHEQGLFVLFSSSDPANILSSSYSDGSNPNYEDPAVTSNDVFIHMDFGSSNPAVVSNQLIGYRSQYGIKLYALSALASTEYDYSQALAILFSYDGFYQQSAYGEDNTLYIHKIIPVLGGFYKSVPSVLPNGNTLIRQTPYGEIRVDVDAHTFDYSNVQIPGYLVDATTIDSVTWQAMAPEVIQAINSDVSVGLIDPDKIGAFDVVHVDKLQAAVVEAINLYADNISAESIEAKIVEAMAIASKVVNTEVVNAGLARVMDLIATSGEFFRISTNMINAINANIDNAKINAAMIGDLTAGHIQAEVIEAIRIAVGDVIGDTATFRTMVADIITGQLINAANVRITSSASLDPNDTDKELLVIDKGGIDISSQHKVNITDQYWPINTKVIRINKNGVAISSDGGRVWTSKLTGSGLSVTSAEVVSLEAGKITAGDITANGDISVTAGKIQVTDGVNPRVNLGLYDGTNYGIEIITTKSNLTNGYSIILDKDGFRTTSGNFEIDAEGNITIVGVIETGAGLIGGWVIDANSIHDSSNSIVMNSSVPSINIGNGNAILGLYDNTDPLNPKYGIYAVDGRIGGLDITEQGIRALIPDPVIENTYIQQFYINPDSISLTGNESLTINTGTMVVKDNDITYLTLGKLGTNVYGMEVSLNGTAYVQFDQAGMRAFNGVENTLSVGSNGNITIKGTIHATSGTLSNLTVSGTITAGDTTINTVGISGTGYSLNSSGLVADKGTIAGWTINTSEIKNTDGSFILDSTNGALKLATNKIVLNKDGSAILGNITIGADGSISSDNFEIDASGNTTITGEVKATTGWFGSEENGVSVGATGLSVIGTGNISGSGFTLSNAGIAMSSGSINLANNFIVTEEGNLTAKSGTIGGVTISQTSLTAGVVVLDASGILVNVASPITIGETGIQSTNFKINVDGSVQITGTVQSANGYFGTSTNGVSIGAAGLEIRGTGQIKAGQSILRSSGISLGSDTSIILKNASNETVFSANNTGIYAIAGSIGGWTLAADQIYSNNVHLNASGQITLGATNQIILDAATGIRVATDKVIIDLLGNLTAKAANIEGTVKATAGQIGGWFIDGESIVDNTDTPNITIAPTAINIANQVTIGKYDATNYGIKAGNTILNASGITAQQGTIGGWTLSSTAMAGGNVTLNSAGIITVGEHITIDGTFVDGLGNKGKLRVSNLEAVGGTIGGLTIRNAGIESTNFTIDADGNMTASNVNLTGTVHADIGTFGSGSGRISASNMGIWNGIQVGDQYSTFWISSQDIQDPKYPDDPTRIIHAGSAYFKGTISVGADSVIDGGTLVIASGAIMAGSPTGAHVALEYFDGSLDGGMLHSRDDEGNTLFRVNRNGAYFMGDITATQGTILGDLVVGASNTVYLDGNESAIFLYDETRENAQRIVRLNNDGLYISEDGGLTYVPALTGGGINANAIKDGVLTIDDSGSGASGILIRQWNEIKNDYVDNVNITPAGINVLNGAITVYSDTTGEILIGGGYLRVKGLDMGVVTSNNFIGNGNFNMVSEDYGVMQKNVGEIFLGRAQSSGGAVSNPTYHYVGWPDFGERDPHTIYTYIVNADGTLNDWDPENLADPNKPNVARSSFNPQWSRVHPTLPYCIVPADADNFCTVIDYEGNIVRQLKAWKGGLFGADFTPDGSKLVVCGDDIDRKRAPWDMVVFDTSDPNPDNWFRLGVIPVGEFPSKVVCDDQGFAYVTVSLDDTIYKLDLVNMRVDKIMTLTDSRGIPVVPMPISISNDYEYIYVGGVVSDFVYEIPTAMDTPLASCRKFSVLPYPGNRGIIHDLCVLPNGDIATSSASTTDAAITILDSETGAIATYIDSTMTAKLAIPGDATEEEIAAWNFWSSTTLNFHPTLPLLYVTVTNRCMISVLSYATGELVEVQRIPTGSNPSGVSISNDGLRLYVPHHHYHTYPLGANRIWGYNSSDNFYATEDVFDTTQRYWHHNPAGMVTTGNGRYIWVANRATNKIVIIDAETWGEINTWAYIENVGNKPYELRLNHAGTKLFVSNNDSDGKCEPDSITVIDVASRQVEGNIYVSDHPVGIDISSDDRYLYVACKDTGLLQKVNIANRKVIASADINGDPRHVHVAGDRVYVTCFNANKLHCFNAANLSLIASIDCDKDPTQMVDVNGSLYISNQGADTVMVIDVNTNTLVDRIETGSRPSAIAYNAVKNIIYVGNSGEGSVCIIDPDVNEVIEWCMTGDNPEYITVSPDGSRWYASAHGPEDIISYGSGTPFTGDAYLDNNGTAYKYGSSYWMPSRSQWARGVDNTLTSFSSVEFWPDSHLQGKQGYAHLTVMGMYDAFAILEQDVYPLNNASDGACEYKVETLDLLEGVERELQEDVADYSGIPGREKRKVDVFDAFDPTIRYTEGTDYRINYETNTITRVGEAIPPSRVRQNTAVLNDTTPVFLMTNGSQYNEIKVFPLNQTSGTYVEGTDYVLDRVANTIARVADGAVPNGEAVTVEYWYHIKVRYFYHPYKRNYEDVVLSADMFWRWPRPENQWVRMEIDELIPKPIYVDNDQIDPWRPAFDFGKGYYNKLEDRYEFYDSKGTLLSEIPQYKGLVYSGNSNRAASGTFTASATPVSGSVDNLKSLAGDVVLPAGEQYITLDIGNIYYINEIIVKHAIDGRTINNPRVQISTDATNWTEVYNNASSPSDYTITFAKTYVGGNYNGPQKVRFVRLYSDGTSVDTTNIWKQVKVMGDWKVNTSYTFASNTIWDSEGTKESYLTLTGSGETNKIRFDNPGTTTDPLNPATPPAQKVRYKIYYVKEDGTHDVRGEVQVFDMLDTYRYVGLRSDVTPADGEHYDYVYDYTTNTMWRTDDSDIADGEEVRIVYRHIQEDLSNLPLSISRKDPDTGVEIPKASVAETDTTGAWVEWIFTNEYRCDWYIGWIADIGLGDIAIYLDGKLIHSISQATAKIERFSQLSTNMMPGTHTIKLVQQQGRVNFDIIKLEDFQMYYRNSNLVASPSINPVELFDWYPTKLSPGAARKYLGRGAQITSGAYDTVQTDKITKIPNHQVPLKYRVRFKTTLEGRGEAVDGEGSYGGEATKNEFDFERGSVMITGVTMELGVNPTYWRMAPAADKYPGFTIESWDASEPLHTGIQSRHIANGAITGDKIKKFEIEDIHISSNAAIQESKLALNFPTHGHDNKAFIDSMTGWGTSGTSTLVARADHTHNDANGDFVVNGIVKEIGKYNIVHRRPLYGIAGDPEFQTDSVDWENVVNSYNPFSGYGIPDVQQGATRYYRLYAIYSDNITDTPYVRAQLRIADMTTGDPIYDWSMDRTWGSASGQRRDSFSPYFQVETNQHIRVQIRIQNEEGTYTGGDGKEIGLDYLELIAYDVFEEV